MVQFVHFAGRLLAHADKVDDLYEAAERFVEAPTSIDKWNEGVKPFGDIAVPIFHDVTGLAVVTTFSTEDEVEVHCQKLGDGKLFERLRKLYESPIVKLLLPLILKGLLPTE